MVDLKAIIKGPLAKAYSLLPAAMNTASATVQVMATCGQESGFRERVQRGGGPAHGWAQFELGKPGTGAGVWGVFEHPSSKEPLRSLCAARNVAFDPLSIYEAIVLDDVLALGLARLLYYTNPRPLPLLGQEDAAWAYYLGTWRPGKPRPSAWPENYRAALAALQDGSPS